MEVIEWWIRQDSWYRPICSICRERFLHYYGVYNVANSMQLRYTLCDRCFRGGTVTHDTPDYYPEINVDGIWNYFERVAYHNLQSAINHMSDNMLLRYMPKISKL